jgi:hypothetical protein
MKFVSANDHDTWSFLMPRAGWRVVLMKYANGTITALLTKAR